MGEKKYKLCILTNAVPMQHYTPFNVCTPLVTYQYGAQFATWEVTVYWYSIPRFKWGQNSVIVHRRGSQQYHLQQK